MALSENRVWTAVSKTDSLVDSVISSIANGEYTPGSKLPPENYYVKEYGLSRVTVREAFKKLNSMGVVSIRQGDGTFVKAIKPFGINRAVLPLLMANRETIEDVYETRIIIEEAILELVIRLRSNGDILALRGIVSEMGRAVYASDVEEYNTLDDNFHDKLTEICGNPVLASIYDSLAVIRKSNIRKSNSSMKSIEKSIKDHQDILDAIEQKDGARAKDLMRRHLVYSQQMLLASKA
jgi:GntR family transcriptional repressor for pyruvate dehydrogenase complex